MINSTLLAMYCVNQYGVVLHSLVVKFIQFYLKMCFYNVITSRWSTKLIATKETNLIHIYYQRVII